MADDLLATAVHADPVSLAPWLAALLALAVLGLLLQRNWPWWVRCLQLAILLGLLAAFWAPPAVQWQPAPRAARTAILAGDWPLQAALQAAGQAGPRAGDLQLRWQQEVALPTAGTGSSVAGPLGAALQHDGEALPFEPQELQCECLRPPVEDRPNALRLRLPAGFTPARGQLRLLQGGRTLVDVEVLLRDGLQQPFVPQSREPLQFELSLAVGSHRIRRTGEVAVAAVAPVLVFEPGEVLAPALQAQGIAVRRLTSLAEWPPDLDAFDAFAAVVVAAPLPEEHWPSLHAAVEAGLGLLVTGPAFGPATSAVRALLPVLPLPPAAERNPADLAGSQPDPRSQPPEAAEPGTAPPPAPATLPPSLDPRAAGPVGSEPIEVDKHAIAMMLVVDRSGSMGQRAGAGMTRMDYARASALQTSEALQQGDQVGVVTFGNKGAGLVELPLTDAMDREAVRRGVAALGARREFTFLLSGLQRADEQLQASTAAVKHVVVISDGEFDVSEALSLRRLAREMRTRGITVSIISIIERGSADLFQSYANEIATLGGGKFLAEADPSLVPVFVSAEVTRALQRVDRQPRRPGDGRQTPPTAPALPPPVDNPPVPEPPQPQSAPAPAEPPPAALPVFTVLPSPLLEPLPADAWPALAAAEATRAPLDALVLLAAGEAGWPLLAFAHRGLGRTAAFASDLAGPDASGFRADPLFPARFARWLDHLARSPGEPQPVSLLQATSIEPPAPTPQQRRELVALAGQPVEPAATGPLPEPGPAMQRRLQHPARTWAVPVLLALLLLAVGERLAQRAALSARQ